MAKDATEVVKSFGDYALITFYYLLRVGEYAVKNSSSSVLVGSWHKRPLAPRKNIFIFQLELYHLLCIIPLYFDCIFSYSQ